MVIVHYLQVSGAKSARTREADKGDQDMFYSSDSELGSGAIKARCDHGSAYAHGFIVTRSKSRWSRSSAPTPRCGTRAARPKVARYFSVS